MLIHTKSRRTLKEMKYKLVKGKRKAIGSYDKYVARAVHMQTLKYEDFYKEVSKESGSATAADVHGVMNKMINVMARHLKDGDTVEFPYLGRMKLEIDSEAVDSEEEFSVRKHVKGFHLRLTPPKEHGIKDLYEGIRLEKMK